MQLRKVQADHIKMLADIFMRAVLDAYEQWFAEPHEQQAIWQSAVGDVLKDIMQLWPLHIDDLNSMVKHLEAVDCENWHAMRRGVSKYVRRRPIGSMMGAERELRLWARRLKYGPVPC